MKKIVVALLLATALLAVAATAAAKTRTVPPINYGVADDTGKYSDDGGAWFDSMLKGANLTEERWTLAYNGDPNTITEMPFIQRAAPQAQKDNIHVVLALYGRPATQHDPTGFCQWAAMVARTVSQWNINDFIVWNEPNTSLYWSPQDSSAPAAYEALLAQCYDSIHGADPNAQVIGMALSPRSNGSGQTAPIPFIAGVGAAYKASGRKKPIMDQMSIHPYPNPNSPTDGPDVGYTNPQNYGVPNLDRVKQAIYDAFNGTAQQTTLNGLTFRIDELGWQTATTQYPQYYNNENVAVVSEQTQANYIQEAVQKYLACDPTVTDVEWFLLVDEATRNGKDKTGTTTIGGGWQSGMLTAGGQGISTEKVSYTQDPPFFAQGRAACASGMVNWTPSDASGGSSGSSGSSGGGGTTGHSQVPTLATLQPTLDLYVGYFGRPAADLTLPFQQLQQQVSNASNQIVSLPSNTPLQLSSDQQKLTALLANIPSSSDATTVKSGIIGFLGNVSNVIISTSQLGQVITQLTTTLRSPAAVSQAKHVLVAAGSASVAAGAKPALTLKALHPKAKLADGAYYLAIVLQDTADPSKRITIAVPVAKVGKAAKPKSTKKPKKPKSKKH